MMWHWLLLGLLAGSAPSNAGATFEGERFGSQRAMTCTWFSNFENSRFERCTADGRAVLPSNEEASVTCRRETCDALDAEARRLAQSGASEPPWGNFAVRMVGRISVARHRPRHLGDGTRTVLVERLLSVEKAR